jgi:tRNA(Ser,Leu) C12 N-acetylase TAN1
MDVIQAIAPSVPSPHRADLNHPDYIINVEVLKMTAGIGILPRYEGYKRFNPQMIAQRYNENKKTEDGTLPSRSLQRVEEPTEAKQES